AAAQFIHAQDSRVLGAGRHAREHRAMVAIGCVFAHDDAIAGAVGNGTDSAGIGLEAIDVGGAAHRGPGAARTDVEAAPGRVDLQGAGHLVGPLGGKRLGGLVFAFAADVVQVRVGDDHVAVLTVAARIGLDRGALADVGRDVGLGGSDV